MHMNNISGGLAWEFALVRLIESRVVVVLVSCAPTHEWIGGGQQDVEMRDDEDENRDVCCMHT